MTHANIRRLAKLGYSMMEWSGDVRISPTHVKFGRTKEARGATPGVMQIHGVDPDVVPRLPHRRTRGAIPVFRGPAPTGPRVREFPYREDASLEITGGGCHWEDVRTGGILLLSTATMSAQIHVLCTHSMITSEKLTDATLSIDKRLISDVRLARGRCDRRDYPSANTPSLGEITTYVWKLKKWYPAAPIKLTTRDVDSAFNRMATNPNACVVLATEFGENGVSLLTFTFRSGRQPRCLPCGWGPRYAETSFLPPPKQPEVDGIHGFHSVMSVGDAIMADVELPDRLNQVGAAWGIVSKWVRDNRTSARKCRRTAGS